MKRIACTLAALAALSSIAFAQEKKEPSLYGLVAGDGLINVALAENVERTHWRHFRRERVTIAAGTICHLIPEDKALFVESAGDSVIVKRVKRYRWRKSTEAQLKAVGDTPPCPFRKKLNVTKAQWEQLRKDEEAATAKITGRKSQT